MATTLTDQLAALEAAERALHEEHYHIREVLAELEQATGTSSLADQLERLHRLLKAHFDREQFPAGLYDCLGVVRPEFADEVRELVDEHFRLLSLVQGLHGEATQSTSTGRDLRGETSDLVRSLRKHEAKEHALAQKARREAATARV